MENKEEKFAFTYSAAQQEEVRHIRDKYLPKEESKMDQLRKLDRMPYKKAQAVSIAVGTVGALILGTGMSLFMTDLGVFLGSLVWAVGIAVGILGMVLVALAYPLYNRVLKKTRQQIAPEILRLTDELMR